MGLAHVLGRAVSGAAVAALTVSAARRSLDADPPGGAARWTRTNHRGEPISLLEGPAVAAGLVAGALVAAPHGRTRAATAIATAGAGAFGLVDDLVEDTSTRTKGLRGHLGALARGRVTTGGLKVLGIGATSMLAAAVGTRRRGSVPGHALDVLIDGALVAGTANLVNLLDLRPGRALKASAALSLPVCAGAAGGATGAVLGSAAAAAAGDLGERDMLGDGGANALGALVGAQWAFGTPRAVRLAALAGVVGLTLASERVSFSAVIDRTPWLRRVDELGRRPRLLPAGADHAVEGPAA
jgi:UDP-N-acetylmuramyl pentapeptide phosphotransferase/UDP-N-acetylglucosamine-1-phosphate transferase